MTALKVLAALVVFDVVVVGLWVVVTEVRSRRPYARMDGIELDVFGCLNQCPRLGRHESDRKYRKRLRKHCEAIEDSRRLDAELRAKYRDRGPLG